MEERKTVLQPAERIPFRWRRDRLRVILSRLIRACCLVPMVCLILIMIIMHTNAYSRTYLALAHRFHWNLSETRWEGADLTGCDLSHLSFQEAYLNDATLQRTDFSFSDLTGVRLMDSRGQGTKFDGAVLSEADMINCVLTGASFRNTDLTNADMRGLFKNADFSHANMQHVNLDATDLSDANLESANLTGAHYNEHTTWPTGFHLQDHHEMVNDGSGIWNSPNN